MDAIYQGEGNYWYRGQAPGTWGSGENSNGGGRPGQGRNGYGQNGVYYDWSSGTYRSTSSGYNEVGWNYAYNKVSQYGNDVSAIIFSGTHGNPYKNLLGFHYSDGSSFYYKDGVQSGRNVNVLGTVYNIANAINEFNPVAQLMDVIAYGFTGNDRFGNNMSIGQGMLKALAVIPVGKIGAIARNSFKYLPRVERATDLYHSFPTLFDKQIIENGAWSQRIIDRANWFESPGHINGVDGIFQIGRNQNGVIFHKNFVPYQQWLKY